VSGLRGVALGNSAMPASSEDGVAGKNFETQRGWLFVNAGPGNDARHESANGERWLGFCGTTLESKLPSARAHLRP
jgi:hypothetical protein